VDTADTKTALDRRGFLRLGGLTVAAGALVAACGDGGSSGGGEPAAPDDTDEETPSTQDLAFLRTATALEIAAIEGYEKIRQQLGDGDKDLADAITIFVEHHTEHRSVLSGATEAFGGDTNRNADPSLASRVEAALAADPDPVALARAAYDIETTLARHHSEAVGRFDDSRLTKTALSTAGAESRHVAVLGVLAQGDASRAAVSQSGLGIPSSASASEASD
jgi:hypothetical protein